MAEPSEIDDSLYSRQRYVLGDGAMQKLAKAKVFIYGLGGVGVEVAKNVILAGAKSITLHDKNETKLEDLGTQFFLRQKDIDDELKRAEACCHRLAELNPYVYVQVSDEDFLQNLNVLKEYDCIVITEMLLDKQIAINNFCRQQTPPISFISCDVYGVFSYIFCDFGNQFEVFDTDGEEPKEVFIESITKANPAVVMALDYKRHGLESGDKVMFKEINGMTILNGQTYSVKYINPYSFSISCNTTNDNYECYQHGGMFIKTKEAVSITFAPLETQLKAPDILINDLSKLDSPPQVLIGIIALNRYCINNRNNLNDINVEEVFKLAEEVSHNLHCSQDKVNLDILKCLIQTCGGKLPPLCAAVGGIVAQEVLKAVSGKFSPLKQWLLLDAAEVATNRKPAVHSNNRYKCLEVCLNLEIIEKLKNLKLFMVGCGAIGCEMMKNYALLGIGTGQNGLLTITDNDLIEKSNLNRQFLFRAHHIQKLKSVVAAQASKEINPDLKIAVHQNKVCPDTQENVYNDDFFQRQDVVVNALDSVEARRYVDGRCVSNQISLLETGTMGPKGHVQVIAPQITESYSNQRDPADEDVPYCTLKSFPQVIEHTIQWARDKFESLFNLKPDNFNKFWEEHICPVALSKKVTEETSVPDGFVDAVRLLQNKPADWPSCVAMGRHKFEQYFNHKAKQLLEAFPLGTKVLDGSLFWQSPKRPPTPIMFSPNDAIHMMFVISLARLVANVNNLKVSSEDLKDVNIQHILQSVDAPKHRSSIKKADDLLIDDMKIDAPKEEDTDKINRMIIYMKGSNVPKPAKLNLEYFEKDDDSNGHIDFITAASNLRAMMYNIQSADRFKTKRITGRIIPAIATTTAAISGLAAIELIKLVAKQPLENLKNCFLNLALPMMVLSEPGAALRTKLTDKIEFTNWDRWDVHGHKDYKLKDFIQHFKDKYELDVSMVCHGVRMIYVPIMPGHKKRLNEPMTKLLKAGNNAKYMDLIIAFDSLDEDAEDDLSAPAVRYFL